MGGWGELHGSGIGTTRQIEDAHRALDAVGMGPGPVATRAIEAAGAIDRLRSAFDVEPELLEVRKSWLQRGEEMLELAFMALVFVVVVIEVARWLA